jgi:Ca2+-binding RTX toxin-like protein
VWVLLKDVGQRAQGSRIALLAKAFRGLARYWKSVRSGVFTKSSAGMPAWSWISVFARGGDDSVNAGDGNDRVHGNRGNDTLNGDGGNDRVWGGVGNDTISGGDGNDVLRGRPGNDTVDGGPGNDVIWVGHGADVERGGDGDDRLHALARDRQVDQIDCGAGHDVVWLNATEQDTHVNCEVVKTVSVVGNGGDN